MNSSVRAAAVVHSHSSQCAQKNVKIVGKIREITQNWKIGKKKIKL